MRVDVDEARGNGQVSGINLAPGRTIDASDVNDAVGSDGNIGVEPRVASAVSDLAVPDNQVVSGLSVNTGDYGKHEELPSQAHTD